MDLISALITARDVRAAIRQKTPRSQDHLSRAVWCTRATRARRWCVGDELGFSGHCRRNRELPPFWKPAFTEESHQHLLAGADRRGGERGGVGILGRGVP